MNIDIINGDSLEVLKKYPDNHFDSIVTDPPYGWSMMGKKWDYQVPSVEVWQEVFRVLKHGGHILCACGTRTQHRMAVNIEDAGFEIRDVITWNYGCLSEDTEVLTENGFVGYNHIRKNKNIRIFAYNKTSDTYELEIPESWSEYHVKDTAYRIQSDYTDQIVSRNHRCLIEREGALVFEFAEKLSQENQTCVPFLESVPTLRRYISNVYTGAGNKEEVLLERMFKRIDFKSKIGENYPYVRKAIHAKNEVCGLQKRNLQIQEKSKKIQRPSLLSQMQWYFKGGRVKKTWTQGKGELETRKRSKIYQTYDRRNKSFMERRNNLPLQEGALRKSEIEIFKVSTGVYRNVEKGWIHTGVPINYGYSNRQDIKENGMRTPYRPQSREQQHYESDVVCNKQRPQKIRGGSSYNTSMATVTPFEYSGLIFCPTVSTGAFVARRNGKIFITGNSGFPKSHDISKAIDNKLGAERKIVGVSNNGSGASPVKLNNREVGATGIGYMDGSGKTFDITEPESEEAKKWSGWGTALKPATEFWTLARKPLLESTVAENVMKHGTGGINIDGCRIATDDVITNHSRSSESAVSKGRYGDSSEQETHQTEGQKLGRFPANVIFDDFMGEVLDEQTGVLKSGAMKKSYAYQNNGFSIGKPTGSTKQFHESNEGGASRFFYCAKPSKEERNKGVQGGNRHPTIKPIKLMQYLVRLVTPKGGLVLDPFNGSGTTGIACKIEGFGYVGIELEKESCETSIQRIAAWDVKKPIDEQLELF